MVIFDGHPRGPFRRRNWPVHHNNCLNPRVSFLQAPALVHRLAKFEATLLKSTMGGVPGHDIALSIPVFLAPDAGLLDADRRAVSEPRVDQQAEGPVPTRRRLRPDCRHMLLQPLPADCPQLTLAPKSWPGILALWLLLWLFASTACTMLRRRRSRRRARRKRLTRAGI